MCPLRFCEGSYPVENSRLTAQVIFIYLLHSRLFPQSDSSNATCRMLTSLKGVLQLQVKVLL